MLANPRFSRDDVRATWQAAARAGVDVADLPQILTDLEALGE
jgi:hypothetical protein